MVKRIIRTMALCLVSCIFSLNSFGQSMILGVLEDVPGDTPDARDWFGVRVVFEKQGDRWRAFPTTAPEESYLMKLAPKYPSSVAWTISFDGKMLGHLKTQNPGSFDSYSTIGLQRISSDGAVPTVGQRSIDYGGFTDAAVYRPLVASSNPYFEDPEGWKPSRATARQTLQLREAFRRKFPKMCKSNPKDESRLVQFRYKDDNVAVVKLYTSNRGRLLARLHLESAIDCTDTEAGFEIDDPWFVSDGRNSARFLDSGIWLVDAGDYDNDGKSEVIFAINRYNRGGYEIFYADFKKQAEFEFNYH